MPHNGRWQRRSGEVHTLAAAGGEDGLGAHAGWHRLEDAQAHQRGDQVRVHHLFWHTQQATFLGLVLLYMNNSHCWSLQHSLLHLPSSALLLKSKD